MNAVFLLFTATATLAAATADDFCGCFASDGTPSAICAPAHTKDVCVNKPDELTPHNCTWKQSCAPAQLREPCCPRASLDACTKRMRAPVCADGLKCYGPDLDGSDGLCVAAADLAPKGAACCLGRRSPVCDAPACETGLTCHADWDSIGVCGDHFEAVAAAAVVQETEALTAVEPKALVCPGCRPDITDSACMVLHGCCTCCARPNPCKVGNITATTMLRGSN